MEKVARKLSNPKAKEDSVQEDDIKDNNQDKNSNTNKFNVQDNEILKVYRKLNYS